MSSKPNNIELLIVLGMPILVGGTAVYLDYKLDTLGT